MNSHLNILNINILDEQIGGFYFSKVELSECLGHSSEHTTQIYLGLLDNSLLDAANDMVASAMTRFSITG